jgi:nucleoprotein TPR
MVNSQLLQSQEYSKTREALVEAQTSRKHLEEKVEDLSRQLKGNEEKLAVYERRPGSSNASQPVDQDVSTEQQLEAEVAELRYVFLTDFVRSIHCTHRSALKVAEVDLIAAKSHRDQFQEISQANEAALVALNATFDEYKESTEASIARYEVYSSANTV